MLPAHPPSRRKSHIVLTYRLLVIYHLAVTISATAVAVLTSSQAGFSFWASVGAASIWIALANAALLAVR